VIHYLHLRNRRQPGSCRAIVNCWTGSHLQQLQAGSNPTEKNTWSQFSWAGSPSCHHVKITYENSRHRWQSQKDTRSFILCGQESSLLWTPALRPFESVQCASPGRGGELIGVCGVCYVGWRRESKLKQLACQVFLNVPPPGLTYCLTKPGLAFVQRLPRPVHRSAPGPYWQLFSASPTGLPFSARPPDWHFYSVSRQPSATVIQLTVVCQTDVSL